MMLTLLSVLVVGTVLRDGKSTWLQGTLLCSAYICIAIGFAFIRPPSLHEQRELPASELPKTSMADIVG
eukprot:SAG11_NODE_6311_length_1340_cov_1.703465_1_plen_69_part_00